MILVAAQIKTIVRQIIPCVDSYLVLQGASATECVAVFPHVSADVDGG